MTEYKDEDDDKLCDWCGLPDHTPGSCLDMIDKSLDTFKRAADRRTRKIKER